MDTRALLARPCVADGHADSLMWNRDLTVASEKGHVDFPRLLQAGVTLQCFTIVTRGFPLVDGFSLFARSRGWPPEARQSAYARALWQIERLDSACARSGGKVAVTKTGSELESHVAAGVLSAVLGIEGAQALEDQVDRVREFHTRGVRFMSLSHLSNNSLAGSSTPAMGNRPLSKRGYEVLDAMAQVGMSVDLAHASPASRAEILAHRHVRPMCSHAGMAAVSTPWRNLPDPVLKRIAQGGGVVGIIFGTVYLGGRTLAHLVRHIRHAVNGMGEEAVGLGSDFDGMVPLPRGVRDVRDLPKVAEALLEDGLPERVVERIMGENWRRFFRETLGPTSTG